MGFISVASEPIGDAKKKETNRIIGPRARSCLVCGGVYVIVELSDQSEGMRKDVCGAVWSE